MKHQCIFHGENNVQRRMLYFNYVLRKSQNLVFHEIQCFDNPQRVPLRSFCNDYLMLMPAFSHYIGRYLDVMPREM